MQPYRSVFDGRIFSNPVPTALFHKGSFLKALRQQLHKPPDHQPPVMPGPFEVDYPLLQEHSGSLKVTWLGHSTLILDMAGHRFLTDPVWYRRASPFSRIGPRRFFDSPVPLDRLPPIDHILLSHDHYDHLDKGTILKLARRGIPVITFLKVGNRLRKWGIPSAQVIELDWWQKYQIHENLEVTGLPARHFSGRWINDRFSTLWGSFAVKSRQHAFYFGADSGYYDGFRYIGDELGPFDLTMLDTGAYNPLWESIHMGPENAVRAHLDLRGKVLLPVHWGTFSLSNHGWTEPVERLILAAKENQVALLIPKPGETRFVDGSSYNSFWWKNFAGGEGG